MMTNISQPTSAAIPKGLARPITMKLGTFHAAVVATATIATAAALSVAPVLDAWTNEAKRPVMTKGEEVYLAMARMGFVEWVGACYYAAGQKNLTPEIAKTKCSSEFLDKARDAPDGADIASAK